LRTIIKAGASYFLATFAAGFVLGTIRVLWLAPRVGPRTAELIEMPVMLGVMIAAAAWVVRRQAVPRRAKSRLAMGGIALVLFLVTEFAVILTRASSGSRSSPEIRVCRHLRLAEPPAASL
jgi:hypothetical protein